MSEQGRFTITIVQFCSAGTCQSDKKDAYCKGEVKLFDKLGSGKRAEIHHKKLRNRGCWPP